MTPPDYDDLCARLRELYVQHGTNYVQAAAEAIESLREQNAALRKDNEWLLHNAGLLHTWALLWTPKIHGTLMDYLRSRIDAAMKDKP